MTRLALSLALFVALPCFTASASANRDDIRRMIERGRWKEARAAVEKLPQGDAETLYLRSRVQLAFGKAEPALALAEQAATLEPKSADYRYQVAEVCGQMARRAGKLKQLGLARRFKKEAEAALALDPAHRDAHWALMEFYSVAPGIVGGDDKKAAALAEEIARIDAVEGDLARALLALRAKKEARAESLYRRAATGAPNNYQAQIAVARFYAADSRKRYEQADRFARAAVAIDPGRAGGQSLLVGLQAASRKWDELETTLAESERQLGGSLTPWYAAARTLLAENQEAARAERYLRKYLTVEPDGVNAPSHAHARWRLSQALERQQRKTEAIAELESALKLDPNLDEAKKDLKRLKRG